MRGRAGWHLPAGRGAVGLSVPRGAAWTCPSGVLADGLCPARKHSVRAGRPCPARQGGTCSPCPSRSRVECLPARRSSPSPDRPSLGSWATCRVETRGSAALTAKVAWKLPALPGTAGDPRRSRRAGGPVGNPPCRSWWVGDPVLFPVGDPALLLVGGCLWAHTFFFLLSSIDYNLHAVKSIHLSCKFSSFCRGWEAELAPSVRLGPVCH